MMTSEFDVNDVDGVEGVESVESVESVNGVNGVDGMNGADGVDGVDSSGTRHVDATPASSAMADMRRVVPQRSVCVSRQRGVAIPGVAGRA